MAVIGENDYPNGAKERLAGGRFVGDIVSGSFKGKRDHERQKLIWDALDAELGAESVRLVGMLLAYTPQEWEPGEDDRVVTKKAKKAGWRSTLHSRSISAGR